MKTVIAVPIVCYVFGFASFAAASPNPAASGEETGRTTQPVEIVLQSNGLRHGTGVLPAGTLVRVLARNGEQALIETRLGFQEVPAAALQITMEPVDFDNAAARQDPSQPARRCGPCPRRHPNPQLRTASRSASQPATSRCAQPSSPSQNSLGKINTASSNPQFERVVLNLTNQVRREQGLPALQWADSLARAARYHAAHMAKYRYFKHDSVLPDGRRMSPSERIAHFDKNYAGEIIAWGQRTPQDAVKGWINSPGGVAYQRRARCSNPRSHF